MEFYIDQPVKIVFQGDVIGEGTVLSWSDDRKHVLVMIGKDTFKSFDASWIVPVEEKYMNDDELNKYFDEMAEMYHEDIFNDDGAWTD